MHKIFKNKAQRCSTPLKGRLAKKKGKKWRLDLLIFSPHMLTNIMNLKKNKQNKNQELKQLVAL